MNVFHFGNFSIYDENNKINNININKNVINIQISFNGGRKCFIELENDNIPFREVISKLIQKYEWAQQINFKKMIFLHNGSTIKDMNKTIRQYEIKDNDIIHVVKKDEDYKV